MSLLDRRRALVAIALAAALPALAGCTVAPLYGSASGLRTGALQPGDATLASIAVKPVDTRVALEVRNHLIFLLTGGAGPPAEAAYTLDLAVTSSDRSAAQIQIPGTTDNEPTAGQVEVVADYVLSETGGARIAAGRRAVTASYDRPRQEFATYRAGRDAEDRAARELAEILRLTLAQDLRRAGG